VVDFFFHIVVDEPPSQQQALKHFPFVLCCCEYHVDCSVAEVSG
jgi:hypothetical protein